MLIQDTQDDTRIRHARDLNIVQIIMNAEAFFESRFECLDARAARMDQRAVDVEKEQAVLCHLAFVLSICRFVLLAV